MCKSKNKLMNQKPVGSFFCLFINQEHWCKLLSLTDSRFKNSVIKENDQNYYLVMILSTLTKYFNPKSGIYRTEEAIYKLNKPPCDEESNSDRKKNHTEKSPNKPPLIMKNLDIILRTEKAQEIMNDPNHAHYHPVMNFFETQL